MSRQFKVLLTNVGLTRSPNYHLFIISFWDNDSLHIRYDAVTTIIDQTANRTTIFVYVLYKDINVFNIAFWKAILVDRSINFISSLFIIDIILTDL